MAQLALIQFIGDDLPDNSLPPSWSGRPNNDLPGRDHSVTLPVFPFDPNNDLPPNTPPVIWPPRPGQRFVVKYLACKGLILVPSNDLPPTAEPK